MSWGTEFTANIFIRNRDVKSIQEAKNLIETTTDEINQDTSYLKMLVSGNIKELTPSDTEPLYFASNTVDELVESIREKTILVAYLNLFIGANGEN